MGMDRGSSGMFTAVNEAIAHGFWYGIAICVGALGLVRIISKVQSMQRLRVRQRSPETIPSKPRSHIAQAYATATATIRELSYPQPVYFTGRISKYFTPPSVGRCLVLAVYWIVILTLLWSNTILSPSSSMYAYKWEKVGFRAAWVSVTQLPFVYLLSCKFNPISIVTGISYERLNWLHRCAARTLFLTIIVHWSFFFREWWLADFVQLELSIMPMVKYGFAAWGVIGWMVLSSFGFFRALSYELFVAQHIIAALVLLWLVYVHVPSYATYNVWLAVALIVFDRGARMIWTGSLNLHMLQRGLRRTIKAPGFSIRLEALPGDMTRLTIEDPDFRWKAGQHAFISIPRLRLLESHPFTIANAATEKGSPYPHRLTMLIKAQSGFSRTLHNAALRRDGRLYRAFLSGPWGCPPALAHYETVVFVATSTGASFNIPLLQDLIQRPGCVDKVFFHWIIRSGQHQSWFAEELAAVAEMAHRHQINLQVRTHITGPSKIEDSGIAAGTDFRDPSGSLLRPAGSEDDQTSSSSSASSARDEKTAVQAMATHTSACCCLSYDSNSPLVQGERPDIESLIRPPVEAALGETVVVACGGLSLTAEVRTFVAALSDERAVHKGTGAQGVMLFCEIYGW